MKLELERTHELDRKDGELAGTHELLTEQVLGDVKITMDPPGRWGRLWIGFLLSVILLGAWAFTWQLVNGLAVTGMREYVSWGVYVTNFVFFIGISHAGTLISAILRVTNAEWRRSITRMAEAITVFALMVGAPMVIVDMGRPDRILHVILYGRLSSPILWDVLSICTYLSGSMLYLYVAMIPDIALLAPAKPVWERVTLRYRFYRFLSLGYTGTPEQKRLLERALATMAIIIIPVAISVHTVVSWIFGMTLRPGWHSTIFGPYFVIGAIYSGTAAIITAMALFRKIYHLEDFLTVRQFQNLGRLMLALNLLYIYFTLSEYLTSWYGAETTEMRLIERLMGHGVYGITFWSWAALFLFLPAFLVMVPGKKRLISRLVVASILINIGMWIKRYLIVVPTLLTPYIPSDAADLEPTYLPTWVEWSVTAGGLAVFLLLFTLFGRLFPMVSIWETVEGVTELGAKNIGVDVKLRKVVPRHRRFRFSPRFLTGLLLLFAAGKTAVGAEAAAEEPEASTAPEITISTGIESEEKVLIATVLLDGKPVEEAEVQFYVERLFGRLPLDSETTDELGKAVISFPENVPGEADGRVRVGAKIEAPPEYAAVETQTTLEGMKKIAGGEEAFPRSLWGPKAPLGVVLTIFTLLSIVWSTYAFVIVQLVKLRKDAIKQEA